MNLIKKTVILSGEGTEGYVSVIRVGNDVGAKIAGQNFEKGMVAALNVGDDAPIFAVLEGAKTEITIDVDFRQNDNIGCIVMQGERVIARGGKSVKPKVLSDRFKNTATTTDSEATEVFETYEAVADAIEQARPESDGAKQKSKKLSGRAVNANTSPLSENDNVDGLEMDNAEQRMGGDGASILEKLGAKDGAAFYNGIRHKVDELFVIYPTEKFLADYIPNSEWIKIYYDGEDYYVVGRITENDRIVLMGYGVPGKKNVKPPKIADEIASWLTVKELTGFDGYWLLFQDATTGKVTPID